MALYHKHRPQDFEALIGQEHVKTTLMNQVIAGSVAHAYLFSGPRGVGKTTSARLLAKAVNCTKRKKNVGEPCNTCNSCEEITKGRSIDVIEIDAASHTGVDNVREEIIENARFQPTRSAFKIFIIDEVHMLSTSAFNALLKILEEPPAHVIFILATTETHKIPDTVISRCQHFSFRRVQSNPMTEALNSIAKKEGVSIDAPVLMRIIRKSDGCLRDAVSLLDQLLATGEKNITDDIAEALLPSGHIEAATRFLTLLLKKNARGALDVLSETNRANTDLVTFTDTLIDLIRALLLEKIGAARNETELLSVSLELKTDAGAYSSQTLLKLLESILLHRRELRAAPVPTLPLEMVIIEWCDEIPEIQKESLVKTTQTTDVSAAWHSCVVTVGSSLPSLATMLQPVSFVSAREENNCMYMYLSVPFAMYRDKLLAPKQKQLLQQTLSDLLGKSVEINIAVPEKEVANTELQELASALGGDVVA